MITNEAEQRQQKEKKDKENERKRRKREDMPITTELSNNKTGTEIKILKQQTKITKNSTGNSVLPSTPRLLPCALTECPNTFYAH